MFLAPAFRSLLSCLALSCLLPLPWTRFATAASVSQTNEARGTAGSVEGAGPSGAPPSGCHGGATAPVARRGHNDAVAVNLGARQEEAPARHCAIAVADDDAVTAQPSSGPPEEEPQKPTSTPREQSLLGKLPHDFKESAYSPKLHGTPEFDRSHLRLGITVEGFVKVLQRIGFLSDFHWQARIGTATWGLKFNYERDVAAEPGKTALPAGHGGAAAAEVWCGVVH